MNILHTLGVALAKIVTIPLIFVMTAAGYQVGPIQHLPTAVVQEAPQPVALGNYNPTGGGQYRLSNSVGVTSTSVYLSSFKEPVSNIAYTMTYLNTSIAYGTLDPGNPTKSEFISFTGITQNTNGTAVLTGVTRGLSRSYPYTASTTLALSHSGQSLFVLSNTPQHYEEYAVKRNDETVTGLWSFPDPTSAASPATKNYVDGKAFGGIGNASETATGTVEIATAAEAQASTQTGSKGRLVIAATLATSTYNSATAAGVVPVTGAGKTIDSNFIATSTLFATSSIYSTTGLITLGLIDKNLQIFSTPGTTTFSVPTGVTRVMVDTQAAGGGGGGCSASAAISAGGGGGGGGFSRKLINISGTSTIQVFVGAAGARGDNTNSYNGVIGGWSTFGTNGFYLSSLGGSGGLNLSTGGAGGLATAGDLNIPGQPGADGRASGASQTAFTTGGNSIYGFGGVAAASASAGRDGSSYGGGGSGAACNAAGSVNGGNGAQGLVIIRW